MMRVGDLPPVPRWSAWLRSRVGFLVVTGAACAALATLLAMFGRWSWWLELLTHFRCQYLLGLAVGAAYSAIERRWWLAAAFGIFAAINAALIIPLYLPAAAQANGGQPVQLMLANVHVRNRKHDEFLQLVRRESPDILLVLEVNGAWQQALASLADEYPYRVVRPREDSFGMAFLSRLPAEPLEVREIGPAEVPSIVTRIDCGNGTALEFVGTHPLPPTSEENSALRDEQLRDIARLARMLPRPTVLAGDLNATSWSPVFRDLIAKSELRDSRRGFGILPTWPGGLAVFGIAIDHVLVSNGVIVDRLRVGPDIGSDHRPVVIDLRISPVTH